MTAALPMGNNKITGMAEPTISTDASTKNYVDALIAALSSTGDVKLTIKNVADSGWLLFDDGSIGSATSGATSRANADTQPLFNLIFTNISDTWAPILTSGGGATTRAGQTNAATAWAANCRISLPKALGRSLAVAGLGSGLTGRSLAQTLGEENHTLVASEIPTIVSSNPGVIGGTTLTTHSVPQGGSSIVSVNSTGSGAFGFQTSPTLSPETGTSTQNVGTISVNSTNTAGGAHNNLPPTSYLNAMIKL